MTLAADALSHLKVKDLQRELKKRGLDTGGLKAALLQRLKEHLQQDEKESTQDDTTKASSDMEPSDKEGERGLKVTEKSEEDKEEKKAEPTQNHDAGSNGGETEHLAETLKRRADAVDQDDNEDSPDAKKPKLTEEAGDGSPQPEDEDGDKPASSEKTADGDAGATEKENRTTLRIDNFVRPFTLNAVKALVQELGDFVEDGFWMDAIKTHCFVTYPNSEIAEKTNAALSGKVWPPENGRSLCVKFADHTAMEVSQYGEANLPSRPKSDESNGTQATQRQKVTIDEFFQKTETKPVLYYLPLTDEEVKERKQRQIQQPEGQPRKRRHRGGRKRNRRARFRH